MGNLEPNYNNLAKLFTSAMFKNLADPSEGKWLERMRNIYSQQLNESAPITVKQFLSLSYSHLRKLYPSEYVYKNEAVKQVVIKNHKINDTVLFAEFPCSLSKADLLVVNGTSTVYEIKTELDSLNRLEEQTANYVKTFSHVNVLTFPANFKRIASVIKHTSVGILTYDPRKNRFETIRASKEDLDLLDSDHMFGILRMPEYKQVIETEYGYVPNVLNTEIYNKCRILFRKLPIEKQVNWTVKMLRARGVERHQISLSRRLPTSLKALSLTCRLNHPQCINIERNLSCYL